MDVTWFAIAASLCMGAGAALVFVFAARRDYFKDLENAKYQVFWSDIEELVEATREARADDNTQETDP